MTLEQVRFDDAGLVAAVVQDATTGAVLMVGYMNAEAIERTLTEKVVWFWSRSRKAFWKKGESSGNVLNLREIRVDCDGDALLVIADPIGPTCHTNEPSCFYRTLDDETVRQPYTTNTNSVLDGLFATIKQRQMEMPQGSYTTYLFEKGIDKIGKKIGEEAMEVVIAAKNGEAEPLAEEVADLFYHTLVLLADRGLTPADVMAVLHQRKK